MGWEGEEWSGMEGTVRGCKGKERWEVGGRGMRSEDEIGRRGTEGDGEDREGKERQGEMGGGWTRNDE
jgi:hypothetical protein